MMYVVYILGVRLNHQGGLIKTHFVAYSLLLLQIVPAQGPLHEHMAELPDAEHTPSFKHGLLSVQIPVKNY